MPSISKNFRLAAFCFLMTALNLFTVNTVQAQRPEPLAIDSEEIRTAHVQGNVYMIATGGANVVVLDNETGLVVVDSGNLEAGDNVAAAIKEISSVPPRFLINTSVLPHRIAANGKIQSIGDDLEVMFGPAQFPIIAHGNSLMVLVNELADEVPYEIWPVNTFFGNVKTLYEGEPIEVLHLPAAITEADVIVHFRSSDVLATGAIFDTTSYPHFHPELGGSLQGLIDALNHILTIAIPRFNQQGGTLIIPGNGRIASESDVVEYRDMLTVIRDRVQIMINDGLSFEEVLAARPSLEYDGIYGYDSGDWTTHMFLEAVYNDLR